MENKMFPFADISLARRLERAEGRGNADFVETRARLYPESGAEWTEVAGVYASYDGASSPLTQTFGLGLFDKVADDEMAAIEVFFRKHGAPVSHEVSPLADQSILSLLGDWSYFPQELTSVLYCPTKDFYTPVHSCNESIEVRLIEKGEEMMWAELSARGWSEFKELADFMLEFGHISAHRPTSLSFFAELGGQPIAAGSLSICEGVALLAGASTIPEGRRQGAQLALLDARLRYAAQNGCEIAMMCAIPGSGSQRNAERHGFRVAYTRTKWQLKAKSE